MNYSEIAEKLIAQFKSELADKYPQYNSQLLKPMRIVRGKKRKSAKSGLWFEKNEMMLAFGLPEIRDYSGKPETYITIYSPYLNGLCLCETKSLEVIEILQ